MEADVWERFDAEFGTEPPLEPVQAVMTQGRRALRRRRLAVGAGTMAAAAVGVVALGQLAGGPSDSTVPAGQPSPTPSATSPLSTATGAEKKLTLAVPVDSSWEQECGGAGQRTCAAYREDLPLVGLRPDGALARVGDDVIVSQRHDLESGTTGSDVVVEARTPTTHPMWFVVSRSGGGAALVRRADPALSMIDFDTFAHAVATGHHPSGTPPLSREDNPWRS
jgi:hypothetical protein